VSDQNGQGVAAVAIERVKTEDDKNREALRGIAEAQKRTSFQQYSTIDERYFRPAPSTISSIPAGMYRVLSDQGGTFFAKDDITSDELILMPDSKADQILQEIKKFRKLRNRYKKFGLLHKRGILMHGPPGSGKSSNIVMVAKAMIEEGDIVLMCQNPVLISDAIRIITDVEPDRYLTVVIEDIDDVMRKHGEHLLLNVLDGDHQVDNIVFLATTNYVDSLPPRVINRPSRFDRLVEIGMPNEEARKLYFKSKVGEHVFKDPVGTEFDLAKMTDGLSIAHLREIIASVYCLDVPVKETIDRLKKMAIAPKTKYGMMERKIGIDMERDYNSREEG
jgi:SpoVK/Ycf46/Vps4 family AAA+-type ATPase